MCKENEELEVAMENSVVYQKRISNTYNPYNLYVVVATVKKMKASALVKPYHIEILEKEIPRIGSREILVKVKSASICATDVARYTGKRPIQYPAFLGHEFSGDVAELGKDVNLGLEEGDRIGSYPSVVCGRCRYCRSGLQQLCVSKGAIGATPGIDGAFSEYVRIPRETVNIGGVVKLPPSVSYDEAALIEPYSTVLNNLMNLRLTLGKTILVIGCGPMGLMHIQLARIMGASKIIAVDLLEKRLEIAKMLGADNTINAKESDTVKKVKSLTDEEGTDIAVATIASQEVIENALTSVVKKGEVSIFGGATKGTFLSLDPNIIHYPEVQLIGSFSAPVDTYHRTFKFISNKRIDVTKLITDSLPLMQAAEAFNIAATAASSESLKVMIHP